MEEPQYCHDCKYHEKKIFERPCYDCVFPVGNWEPKEIETEKPTQEQILDEIKE